MEVITRSWHTGSDHVTIPGSWLVRSWPPGSLLVRGGSLHHPELHRLIRNNNRAKNQQQQSYKVSNQRLKYWSGVLQESVRSSFKRLWWRWMVPLGHNSKTILYLIPLTRVTWPTICHKGLKFQILYSLREMMLRSLVYFSLHSLQLLGRRVKTGDYIWHKSQEQQGAHFKSYSLYSG